MSIRLDLDVKHSRIELRTGPSDWRPSLPAECKSIPGYNWSPTKKAWTYPLSMATLRRMREVFGDELAPADDLLAWARAERRREKRAKSYATHHDAVLRRVPAISPRLAEAMADRTYQRSAARFAAVAGNFLLADEPGLGKTATSLAAIMESGMWEGAHLVVAPKTAIHSTWVRQIAQWSDAVVYGMPEGRVDRSKTWAAFKVEKARPKFLVVNPAMMRRLYGTYCAGCDVWKEDVVKKKAQFKDEHYTERGHGEKRKVRKDEWPEILDFLWTTITVDESHEAFASYKPSNVTQTTQGLLDVQSGKRIALTGTPLRGQERNIWGTLEWLGAELGGYWSFVQTYMEYKQGPFGIEVYGVDPERAEEFHRLLDRYMLRRTRAEVRPDLPLGQRVDVLVEMDKKHKEQYLEFEQNGEAEIENGTLSGQGLLSELTRMKQLAWGEWQMRWDTSENGLAMVYPTIRSPKFEWLMEFLTARGITGKKTTSWLPEPGTAYKYVIASQFTEIVDMLAESLSKQGIKTLKVTGDVTGARRTQAVEKFQSSDTEYRVMLIQTQTGGVSIELDAWCDEMVILDETWVADDAVQLEGRINNRSGRVSPRLWYYVRTAETIEQRIAEANWSQHDLQHQLLDKRRGIEVALHLIRGNN